MFSFKFAGRLAAVVMACVAVLILSGRASAQSYTSAPNPPTVSAVDGNGVDIIGGQVSLITVFDVGIGGAGSGLSRSESSFGDTFRGVIDEGPTGAGVLTVVFQGNSEVFNFVSSGYQSAVGSSNTLSCSGTLCTYTLADGTAAVYDTTITTAGQVSGNYATLTSITKPDGEVITLRYAGFQEQISYNGVPVTITIQHPVTVTSSLGWMLKNHYSNDDITKQVVKVEAINTSVDYCDPTTVTCPNESQTWPYALVNGAGGPTDMLGHSTAFNGGMTTPTSIVSPSGVTKTITYYSSGPFTGHVYQVKIGNSTWTYAYSNVGVIWTDTVTDPNGGIRTLVYDSNLSQIVSDTDPMGRKVSYVYYTTTNTSGAFKGAVSQVIAPDATYSGSTPTGGYIQYFYDGRGNVTFAKTYPKGGGIPMVVAATYPASCSNAKTCNKPLTVTDANGVTTTYAYDSNNGNVASVTLPVQANGVTPQTRYSYAQITPYSYTAPGVLSAQSPVWRLVQTSSCMSSNWNGSACAAGATDERRATVSYGTNSNPTYKNVLPVLQTVSLGDGSLPQTTTFTYDSHGNVTSADGPKSGSVDTVYYFYDALNRQTGMIGPDPDSSGPRPRLASLTSYDNDGRVSETDAGTVTGTDINALNAMTVVTRDTTTFDPTLGLPTLAKHFIGTASAPQNVTQTSYDALLRTDCVAQRLNPVDYNSPPTSACSLGTTGSDGSHDRITKYAYDNDSVPLSSQSGYDMGSARYDVRKTYDPGNGTLTSAMDANGNVTGYYYDLFDRLTKTCYPTASNGGVINTSDCDQVTFTTGVVNGSTQSLTHPYSRILRDGQTINLTYDSDGRVASSSGAVSENLAYDNFGQVTGLTNYTTGGASASETYQYNALGWLMSDAQPAGTVSYQYDAYGKRQRLTWPDGFYVTYGFDDGDELTGIYENGSALIAGFGYDSYGRPNALSRGSSFNDSYGYDSVLRLQTMALAASGGGNTITLGYNQADQITSRSNSNASFALANPGANTSTTYTNDGLNRLTTAGASNLAYDVRGNMTSDGAVTYAYNANNLLTSTSNGASLVYDAQNRLQSYTASGATTKFLYDGSDLIAEYNGTILLRRYVHGPGSDEPLVWYEYQGTPAGKRYLLADERGSIIGVTDASGTVLAVNTYDAYGVPSSTNNAYAGRFRYTGQIYLPELGVYDYKARMYAPTLGRFMQTDPIGYGDGMNMYNYVHSDPVNGRDPSGLCDGPGEPRCPPINVTVTGPQRCPDGASCLSGEEACSMYHCGQDPGGMPTAGQLVNRTLFSPPIIIATVGDMQNCPAAPNSDPGATTNVKEPNGTSIDLPASASGMGVSYGVLDGSAAVGVGAGGAGGKFEYKAANGNIISGNYVTYSGVVGFGAGVGIGAGHSSGGTNQFFGATNNFNASIGPITPSVGFNHNGKNANLSGGPGEWKFNLNYSYSNTVPVGNVVSKGCWTSKGK